MKYWVLTHGGAGSPERLSGACRRAARAATRRLEQGATAFEAAIAATVVMEDEPQFNAGTGSAIRLDGKTIQMDAAIACSDGRFGAVAGIERVKNPILVAARVTETPHLTLVGDGATAFARRLGFPDHDPTTEAARQKHARGLRELAGAGDGTYAEAARAWRTFEKESLISKFWNFSGPPPQVVPLSTSPAVRSGPETDCDTVGAVVRDIRGGFAATASTGGVRYTLRGRVGDSPQFGAGLYAGPEGAVAATGVGEAIVRRLLAKTVYDWLAQGTPPWVAARQAIALFPRQVEIGVLVVSQRGAAIAANRPMASAMLPRRRGRAIRT